MTHTVYVKLDEITELTHKDILLNDVAQVYCRDQNIQNKCSVCRIMTVRSDEAHRYVMSALDVTKKLEALDPGIEVEHMGKTDFIIAYKPAAPTCSGYSGSSPSFNTPIRSVPPPMATVPDCFSSSDASSTEDGFMYVKFFIYLPPFPSALSGLLQVRMDKNPA